MEGDPSGIVGPLVKVLVDLGLPGVLIAALGWHDWQIQKRNMALNDMLLKVMEQYATSTSTMTAALNRISDLILRGNLPSE